MPVASVLDACAMLAYLNNEPGADIVEDVLSDPTRRCYAHTVNICETYYHVLRKQGQTTANAAIQKLLDADLVLNEDIDEPFWKQAGQNKVAFTLALGDCFCLALAQQLGGEVVTSDHQFDPVAAQGICAVRFIR